MSELTEDKHRVAMKWVAELEARLAARNALLRDVRAILHKTRETFGIDLPATFAAIERIDKELREGPAPTVNK